MATGAVYNYDALGRLVSVEWDDGAQINYQYDDLGNRKTVMEVKSCCPPEFTIYEKDANFTADDGGNSYYRITGDLTVTLPASEANGDVLKFKVLSGSATFVFFETDVIFHANGDSDQDLALTPRSGVIEIISTTGGYDET